MMSILPLWRRRTSGPDGEVRGKAMGREASGDIPVKASDYDDNNDDINDVKYAGDSCKFC